MSSHPSCFLILDPTKDRSHSSFSQGSNSMAWFNSLPLVTISFLLCNMFLIAPGLALIKPSQSMPSEKINDCWYKLDHYPNNFLKDCSEEIDDAWFDRAFSITRECCQNLLAMGKTCYADIVNDQVASLNLTDKYVPRLPENSKRVWNYCVSSISP